MEEYYFGGAAKKRSWQRIPEAKARVCCAALVAGAKAGKRKTAAEHRLPRHRTASQAPMVRTRSLRALALGAFVHCGVGKGER